MTAVSLKVTGDEKENVTQVVLSQGGVKKFRWGGVNGHPFDAVANVPAGNYDVTFNTSKGHENKDDVDITGASGTLTVEDNENDFDISYEQN